MAVQGIKIALVVLTTLAAFAADGPSADPPLPRPYPAASFPTVVIDDPAPGFTGEPISLSLKDADVKDVLKTFATLTGLNIVVDPSVAGSVTLELHDVPWDQAFELILAINGLDFDMLGNVVYVAPAEKLARQPLYGRDRR